MKKLLISGFLYLFIQSFAVAENGIGPIKQANSISQEGDEAPKLMFGLKFAPSFNWFALDRTGYSSDGVYLGYIYGVVTDFRIAQNYYFSTGLEASQRGGKYKSNILKVNDNDVLADGKVTQRLHYLDIPVALKLKTNEIGYSKYYGKFGVIPGFLTKANRDVDYSNAAIPDVDKGSNMKDFGLFNMGIILGAGMEYKFSGNSALNVGINFQNSFIDVWSEKDAKISPNYISIDLGLFF